MRSSFDICDLNDLNDYITRHTELYVYGAGHFGMGLHSHIDRIGCADRFLAYFETNKREETCLGKPILQFDDTETIGSDAGVIISVSGHKHEIEKHLLEAGYKDIACLDDCVFQMIEEKEYNLSEEWLTANSAVEKAPDSHRWKNILLIKLDGIGDAVLCTPFLREFRRNHRESLISLIVAPHAYDLMQACPYVDNVFKYTHFSPKQLPNLFLERYSRSFMDGLSDKQPFDAAIVLRYDVDYYGAGFLAYYSGAEERIGYSESVTDRKKERNRNYNHLYTNVLADNSVKSEAQKNLEMIEWMGGIIENRELELWDDPKKKISKKGDILIGMSGSTSEKRWPTDLFFELIECIHEWNKNLRFVILGDEENKKDNERHKKDMSEKPYILDLSGCLSLADTAIVARKTKMYIGNDTGIMHIAAACGNQIVVLNKQPYPVDEASEYGDVRFAPWMTKHIIMRPPAKVGGNKEGRIKDISVQAVFDAAISMMV